METALDDLARTTGPDAGGWVVIHNPTAGWRRRRRVARVLAALAAADRVPTVLSTTRRGDAEAGPCAGAGRGRQ